MDTIDDSQATQQATQKALDPRRFGQQNSGFSDEDISDIICLLYPITEAANYEVQKLASSPEHACHTTGRYTADTIESDLYHEDDARDFGSKSGIGAHALVLRLSSSLKDPRLGFTFGRNPKTCDICFFDDPHRRLSNVHFRIYVNSYGSVLLEDESTNGTLVDNKMLQKRRRPSKTNEANHAGTPGTRRTLESGSTINIIMHAVKWDLKFLVRIPRRDEDYQDAYMRNVEPYLLRLNGVHDVDKTIGPGPSGHVQLFAPTNGTGLNNQAKMLEGLPTQPSHPPREWRGSDKYARVGVIGKGAFATVYKVTSKYDGSPYAAKELDKRKFMKNGVLDQKVENEMKIMQRVKHDNIVRYIEHFDFDKQIMIVMEFVAGGDLGRLVHDHGAIPEPHVKTIAGQLVDALGYLHDNKITHRDVKPDNILIHSRQPPVVKLTDFGLSKMIDTEQTFLKTFCGTLLYCAPEVYTEYSSYDDYGHRTNRKTQRTIDRERYDHAVDIWSLGGVLFYALTENPPFPVQNGVTYTELLDHIMKTNVDITPLIESNVSELGIQFLSRMIHVRPETRATTIELKTHSWLRNTPGPVDQESDEALGYSASQLSLDDRQSSQAIMRGVSSLRGPEPDLSMDSGSEDENLTLRQPRAPRLFGEVSAVGSSGVVPEGRLNLPISADTSPEMTERASSEVRDSFEDSDDFSTPRGAQNQSIPLAIHDPSQPDNSHSALLGFGSQSLGGASSILENLNMKSVVNVNSNLTSLQISNVTTSKRKPNYDSSDEYNASKTNANPSLKRLKSEGHVDASENEDNLLASMPEPIRGDTERQIDYPVHKMVYWDSQDERTWHLNYPEMTHIQYSAFELAAEKRNELFAPGQTPLWELAMKYFPPGHNDKNKLSRTRIVRPGGFNYAAGSTRKSSGYDLPPTVLSDSLDNHFESQVGHSSLDEDMPSDTQSTQGTLHQPRTEVGVFKSVSGSLVSDIFISLQDPVISWGRDMGNTAIYQPATESRVPKNAFRVVLWTDGYTASSSELRPWEPPRSVESYTMRASPDPDAYAFYIATKATNGIRINGNPLPSHEPKDTTAICRHWMKLYHGDYITFWGGESPRAHAKLQFECFWGGSSVIRPADEPPTCVPASISNKLDRLWPRAVRSLRHSYIKEEAQIDQEKRMHNMLREQKRCRMFENLRLEAVRRVAQKATRSTSPTSPAPERARTGPPVYRFAPPGRVQGGRW